MVETLRAKQSLSVILRRPKFFFKTQVEETTKKALRIFITSRSMTGKSCSPKILRWSLNLEQNNNTPWGNQGANKDTKFGMHMRNWSYGNLSNSILGSSYRSYPSSCSYPDLGEKGSRKDDWY